MKLNLINLTKKYSKKTALDTVNINIDEGSLVLFVGENGSGKTTALKIISSIEKLEKNDDGKIENTYKKISFLPDKCSYPSFLNAADFISNYSSCNDVDVIKDKMKLYNLPNDKIKNMSKGMIQKLGVLANVMKKSDLYLFDEPIDGLDDISRLNFKKDITKLLKEGKTVVISTHHRLFFKGMNETVYKFENGIVKKRSRKENKE